jgi:hypothetical protein
LDVSAPETEKSEATLRVTTFSDVIFALAIFARVRTNRLVMFDVATFSVVTFALAIFARVRTNRLVMFDVATFSVVTFALAILASVRTNRLVMFAVVRTFRLSIFAVPSTYKFEPVGGFERVPILTPFWYATFPDTVVHCVGTLLADVKRPY